MKTDIRKMIAEAYELEGLLLLADNRGADTPEYVFTAIGEKLDRLQMLLGEREGDEGEETQEDTCMVENDEADAEAKSRWRTRLKAKSRNQSRRKTWRK